MKNLFIRNGKEKYWVQKAQELASEFKKTASIHDVEGSFPFDHFSMLKDAGITALTVQKEFGGQGLPLYSFLLVQEEIAKGDGATALCLGWHNGTFIQLNETEKWTPAMLETISREAVEKGILINSAATEPKTGSPARGGKPETEAKRVNGNWVISGRKTFTSLAPALDYYIVTAWIEEKQGIGEFLIPKEADGLRIEETWNTLGMRSTRSDDLILEQVKVPAEYLVSMKGEAKKKLPQAWLLHIPACYLGIASAARDFAVEFAKEYQPNSLSHPISEIPEIRRKVALMDVELMKSRHFLYHVASLWEDSEKRNELGPTLMAVKTEVTNSAMNVVDLAMRIVGGHSLSRGNPLERYYRDVRAGLHNPPSDDITYKVLGDMGFREEA